MTEKERRAEIASKEAGQLSERQAALREGLAEHLYIEGMGFKFRSAEPCWNKEPWWRQGPFREQADAILGYLTERGVVMSNAGEWFKTEHHCLSCADAYREGFTNATAPLTEGG